MTIFSGSFNTTRTSFNTNKIIGVDVNSKNSLQNALYYGVMPALTALSQSLGRSVRSLSITVAALNNNTIRVSFSAIVTTNVALTNPANYVFTPSLTVNSVTASNPVTASYVDLNVSGMTARQYSLTIQTIDAAS